MFNERQEILLVERAGEPLRGYWSLPGGIVEVGETLAAATAREVLEETGLIVTEPRFFEIFERIMPDADGHAEYHYVLIDSICRVSGSDELRPASDVSGAAWVSRADLQGYTPMTEGTLAVIQRAFDHVQGRGPE